MAWPICSSPPDYVLARGSPDHRNDRACLSDPVAALPLAKLAGYYTHLADLARDYGKVAARLQESLRVVNGWREDVEKLAEMLA